MKTPNFETGIEILGRSQADAKFTANNENVKITYSVDKKIKGSYKKFCEEHGLKVVIFGTGNYGSMAFHALKDIGRKVDYFCDNNKHNWGKYWKGCKIISPAELKKYSDAIVIIASLHFQYMRKQLNKMGISRIYDCDFLLYNLDLTEVKAFAPIGKLSAMRDLYMYAINEEKHLLKIKTLDVVVTERCSLRCLNCSNLMQYYKKPRDCSINLLLNSLNKFMQNVDELYEARVLGGEPFIYKELPLVIKRLASYDNCSKIIIFTNGTIVPKDVSYLKDKKVSVMISDYGTLSRNKVSLMKLLEKMKIPFVLEKVDIWQDCAKIKYRKRSKDKLKQIFGNCCVYDVLTLLHGKLYRCPFAAHAENLEAISTEEHIDLIEETQLKDKIRNLSSCKDFIQACQYCNGRDFNVGSVQAAEQLSDRGVLC